MEVRWVPCRALIISHLFYPHPGGTAEQLRGAPDLLAELLGGPRRVVRQQEVEEQQGVGTVLGERGGRCL